MHHLHAHNATTTGRNNGGNLGPQYLSSMKQIRGSQAVNPSQPIFAKSGQKVAASNKNLHKYLAMARKAERLGEDDDLKIINSFHSSSFQNPLNESVKLR